MPGSVPPTFPRARLSNGMRTPDTSVRHMAHSTWVRITGTSHFTPGSTTTHAHGLGRVPRYVWIERLQSQPALTPYEGGSPDATNISIKSQGSGINFVAWVL